MLFSFTDEELMIRDAAKRFAQERLAPNAERLDSGEGREAFLLNLRELAQSGFMTMKVAAEFGGSEAGCAAFALAVEEIAYVEPRELASIDGCDGQASDFVPVAVTRRSGGTRLAAGPVVEVRFPLVGKVWTTTTQDLANEVLRDSKTFTLRKEDGAIAGFQWWMPKIVHTIANNMLAADEPDHTRLRGIVDEVFRRRAVLEMQPRIMALAGELADVLFAEGSPADLVDYYPQFYWSKIERYINDALRYLEMTMEGKQWIATLYSHIFAIEHNRRRIVPQPGTPQLHR